MLGKCDNKRYKRNLLILGEALKTSTAVAAVAAKAAAEDICKRRNNYGIKRIYTFDRKDWR